MAWTPSRPGAVRTTVSTETQTGLLDIAPRSRHGNAGRKLDELVARHKVLTKWTHNLEANWQRWRLELGGLWTTTLGGDLGDCIAGEFLRAGDAALAKLQASGPMCTQTMEVATEDAATQTEVPEEEATVSATALPNGSRSRSRSRSSNSNCTSSSSSTLRR